MTSHSSWLCLIRTWYFLILTAWMELNQFHTLEDIFLYRQTMKVQRLFPFLSFWPCICLPPPSFFTPNMSVFGHCSCCLMVFGFFVCLFDCFFGTSSSASVFGLQLITYCWLLLPPGLLVPLPLKFSLHTQKNSLVFSIFQLIEYIFKKEITNQ